MIRKIYQMTLDLGELFRVLKAVVQVEEQKIREAILVDVENKILNKVLQIEQHEY